MAREWFFWGYIYSTKLTFDLASVNTQGRTLKKAWVTIRISHSLRAEELSNLEGFRNSNQWQRVQACCISWFDAWLNIEFEQTK